MKQDTIDMKRMADRIAPPVFTGICQVHRCKLEVKHGCDIHYENGDVGTRYKCPIPKCRYEEVKVKTKKEVDEDYKELLDFMREKAREDIKAHQVSPKKQSGVLRPQ